MLKHIAPNIPASYRDYYEPFLGGGAVALHEMASYDALPVKRVRKFVLSDYSRNVVDAWTAVKDYPQATASILKTMLGNHCREHFLEIRNWDREGLLETRTVAERGARFIYLLQTCFGGAIKENKHGHASMTYAWKPEFEAGHAAFDYQNLFAVSELLNRLDVTIRCVSYDTAVANVSYGDFVYLDPPYDTKSDTGEKLTSNYVADAVSQDSIRDAINELGSKGAMVLMSNSNTAGIRDLYKGWAFTNPSHFWAVGGAGKTGQEILVSNWRLADRLAKEAVTFLAAGSPVQASASLVA